MLATISSPVSEPFHISMNIIKGGIQIQLPQHLLIIFYTLVKFYFTHYKNKNVRINVLVLHNLHYNYLKLFS